MASRFLFNESLWSELTERVANAKRTVAAVAYLGAGASELVPLKKGDKLVVDMSLKAVRSGTTDPREVKKLLKKGVAVFSRAGLHAKFFVIDDAVIVGSANVSKHGRDCLDEAAVLTDDAAVLHRALATINQLCTEPIDKQYLERCIAEYRPPRFVPARRGSTPRGTKKGAKLWIIGGLRYEDIPEEESDRETRVVERAARALPDYELFEVDYAHYPSRLRFFDELGPEDSVVTCLASGRGFDVYPPARFIRVDDYARGNGKRRYFVLLSARIGAAPVRWSTLRRSVPRSNRLARWAKPKTSPIVDEAEADAILRLWDSRGRFKGRKA